MSAPSLAELQPNGEFPARHIGPDPDQRRIMLERLGVGSLAALIEQVVPGDIRENTPPQLPVALSEAAALAELKAMASHNQVLRSFIGQGYYNCHVPAVIQRNVLENPGWYTAYTPYQPEISQGRLEALLNFQTMVTELTAMDISNASLLDEATAAAEAMALCHRAGRKGVDTIFIAEDCHPQTLDVVRTRAEPLGLSVVSGDPERDLDPSTVFAVMLQYPGTRGVVRDYRALARRVRDAGALVIVAADLLALTVLTPPGEWGADVVVGSSQRFGVPLGYGGPHAGFIATRDAHKRSLPGRLVGVTQDANGGPAYRLALQTREQHIRREKATSNICTAQVLLAVMAGLYAAWHGPEGLTRIAQRVHRSTAVLATGLIREGFELAHSRFFDTLCVKTGPRTADIHDAAEAAGINLRHLDEGTIGISLDETVTPKDLEVLLTVFGMAHPDIATLDAATADALPAELRRNSAFLTHPVFHRYRSETEMMRYLRKLSDKDLALDRAMIPLGSCTMKLNAATEMMPVSWPEFANMHPFAPAEQAAGYQAMIDELERALAAVTGYDAVSLQPNSGAQGEYAGLLAIRGWHASRGEGHRNVCLIPSSAHGTNPASAQMAGMKVVVVSCDRNGNVDVEDLRTKAAQHADKLAAVMITYPSTHGVFETAIREICAIIHEHGGQVYLDGANLNAQVGLCAPGHYGADVSHLNLHKTFCIPHGGGGPGVGPIGVRAHLAPFLPGHRHGPNGLDAVGPVAAAPFGSAGILPITWTYLRMMGPDGLTRASEVAILNANYIAARLKDHYPVLYTGARGRVAHECIIDLRPLKDGAGISVEDVAKRLMDYGFHAPTMSWPVAGTLMIEPTESESLAEIDRFCDAMIAIRDEIRRIEDGQWPHDDNPLVHAPHTAAVLAVDEWTHPYSRETAVFPGTVHPATKYWPPVARVDNAYGDRNLVCACPPMSSYEENA